MSEYSMQTSHIYHHAKFDVEKNVQVKKTEKSWISYETLHS
jgi:hypothetical protein